MEQLIVIQQAALASFLANTEPSKSVVLLLFAPNDLDVNQLKSLAEHSSDTYWLCPQTQALPFGQHADYDKWAELSVQYVRCFFWPT